MATKPQQRSKQSNTGQRLDLALQENALLSERLAALEFALESMDWRLLTAQAEQEFSREGLRIITELSRIMYLKNPLIQRGVRVQRLYVWGQGMSTRAPQAEIQTVLDAFIDDPLNQAELTGHYARGQKEVELQTDGNLFFVLFVNQVNGRVRVRSIPFDEISDKICNPQDSKETWFYLRRWTETVVGTGGATEMRTQEAYYPDWLYTPKARPSQIGNITIRWDSPVLHVWVGGFSNWKFGVSEIYAAIDWARAYKEFLEDWASIVRAYRKFAFQLNTPGGKTAIAAAKTKLGTTLGSNSGETNPAPVAGSTFIAGEGVNLQPVRTSGATVSAEDGRRILLMVAAAMGLPETFFGDASVGTLATAQSLDRPTELMMRDRQTLWADVLMSLYRFVLLWAVKAPLGALRTLGKLEREIDGEVFRERVAWNAGVDPHLDIDFPPILQQNMTDRVTAVVEAATLGGRQPSGALDLPTITRMLLVALGEDDVDEILRRLFDEEGNPRNTPTPAEPQGGAQPRPTSEALMVEAVKELRNALANLRE